MTRNDVTGRDDARHGSPRRRLPAESRILVVDDAELLLSSLLDLLAAIGYQTWGAKNGCEALRQLETGAFDIVLLELKLPDLDGYTLCYQIHQRYELPVVVMSGFSVADARLNALAAGASAFVGKPFSVRELQHAINETLAQCSLRARVC
jgi:CheY-like chemotaxis protein